MIKVGVIGYGYWGPNLVRNFNNSSDTELVWICDQEWSKISNIGSRYPSTRVTSNPKDVFNDPLVDAVAIATPVSAHFDLALQALTSGKHVLVEKPITSSPADAQQLIDEAAKRKLVLMVDHTFPYTDAVVKIKELIDAGELGDVYYYDSIRVNLGLFQHDVNVIWDLAVHDLAILDYILPSKPTSISATGLSHIAGQPENVAYLTLFFDGNTIAHINVNWLAPVKIRQTLIGGSRKMILYDDLEATDKIKVYDKEVSLEKDRNSIHQLRVGYRVGDMWSPHLAGTEALKKLVSHFSRCITEGETPLTGGESGLRIVRMLEAATQSMRQQGAVVKL